MMPGPTRILQTWPGSPVRMLLRPLDLASAGPVHTIIAGTLGRMQPRSSAMIERITEPDAAQRREGRESAWDLSATISLGS